FRRYILIAQPYYTMYVHKPNMYIDENGMVVTPLRYFASPNSDRELQMFEKEYRLAVSLRIGDMCGNKSVENSEVHVQLDYPPPAHAEMYDELPCSTVKFNCEQSALSAHYLFITQEFRPFRKNAFDRLIAQCEEEFQKANLESSTTRKVRWHISAHFNSVPGRQITLEDVADTFATTPRSLTRKLAAEGTSFRNILHEVRMEIASHHLQSSKLSVDRIAEIGRASCRG